MSKLQYHVHVVVNGNQGLPGVSGRREFPWQSHKLEQWMDIIDTYSHSVTEV